MTKFQIRKIVTPMDFSETAMLAIEHAAHMARLFNAEIILAHVQEKNWQGFNIIEPEATFEVPPDFSLRVQAKLEEFAQKVSNDYGVKTSAIVTNGNVYNEIISIVEESGADLIVMGTHGTSGFEEFFVGSNTYRVVTRSKVPVLSVQTHARSVGFKEIVLPIDNSTHSRQKVNHALVIARAYNSRVHIAGLLDEADVDEAKFMIKLEQVNRFLHNAGVNSVIEVVRGTNQATLTIKHAKQVNADLIIIMTDQEENLTGRLLGPYAQQVVNHSWIPVLSVQPEEGNYEFPSLVGDSMPFDNKPN
jgi:nucleotide-binding universal stress UspA family protein